MIETDVTKEKCYIIAEIVNRMKDIYNKSNIKQKAFIETIIGASLWYLPKPIDHWSGFISVGLIRSFSKNKNTKKSQEHIIPRKISAKELFQMNISLSAEFVKEKYLSRYCKIHYLTQEENIKARNFQKEENYVNSDEVYKKSGIELIEINNNILRKVEEGDMEVINKILELYKKGENIIKYFEMELNSKQISTKKNYILPDETKRKINKLRN